MACACVVLGGCASEFEVVRAAPGSKPPVLSQADSVYVVVPPDGKYGEDTYTGSGHDTAAAVAKYFATRCGRAEIGEREELPEQGLETARRRQFAYCASPRILQWEDRATEWSGKRDKLSIGLIVTQVSTGRVVDNAVISAVGTWWTLGGLHPQDLLDRMMKQYEKSATSKSD